MASSVLNSWKEIASFMGRGVRTVQRWEQHLGLPVHRPKGKDRSAVLAFPDELNAWLHQTPVKCLTTIDNGENTAAELLELARELVLQGERLAAMDPHHRTEAENVVAALRDVVHRLAADGEIVNGREGVLKAAQRQADQLLTWPRTDRQRRA